VVDGAVQAAADEGEDKHARGGQHGGHHDCEASGHAQPQWQTAQNAHDTRKR
jgi:hypothetical protein